MISYIKKKIVNIYSCGFLVLAVLTLTTLQSCQKQPINPMTNYTGEELYEGIFFGTGKVGEQLTILHGMRIADLVEDQTAVARVKSYNQKILAEIKSTNPNFFKNFKEKIDTKSPTEIATALDNGYNQLTMSIVSLNGGAPQLNIQALENSMGNASTPEEARAILKMYLENALGKNNIDNGNSGGVDPQKKTCWALAILIGVALAIIYAWVWYLTKYWPEYIDRVAPVGFYHDTPDLFQEQLILQISNL